LWGASPDGWGETWQEIEPNLVNAIALNDVGRIDRRREYADLLVFLAGPVAGYVTGATLRADDGRYDA
jgi:3-oxoacyl-[acyl-carrier protein] reductase